MRVDRVEVIDGAMPPKTWRCVRRARPCKARKTLIVAWGGGVAWACGVDYSADSLARLAEEQRSRTAAEFVRWQKKMTISNREAADLLDRSLTTIKNYRSGAVEISLPVATTVRAMMHDPTVFVAHFRSRKTG